MDAVLLVLVLVVLVSVAMWLGRDPSAGPAPASLRTRHRRTGGTTGAAGSANDGGDGPLRDDRDDAGAARDRPEGPTDTTLYGPFLSPSGTILAMPEPLAAGPPQPEPDESWTLAPGARSEPASSTAGDAAEYATAEHVRARVRRAPDQRTE